MSAVNERAVSSRSPVPSASASSSSVTPAGIADHPSGSAHPATGGGPRGLLKVSLGALGIVYGDIGTSPLYTIRECFTGEHGVPPSTDNVLGILSLVFWALMLVVVLKYLTFIR
jgi:KUP system potassium uptake protein